LNYEDFYAPINSTRLKQIKKLLKNTFKGGETRKSNYVKYMNLNKTWTALDYMEKFLLTNLNTDYRDRVHEK
jgi:hypothetical protein